MKCTGCPEAEPVISYRGEVPYKRPCKLGWMCWINGRSK